MGPAPLRQVAKMGLPEGQSPTNPDWKLAVDTIHNRVFVGGTNGITIIDGATQTVTAKVGLDPGNYFALNPVTRRLYASQSKQPSRQLALAVIDTALGKKIAEIPGIYGSITVNQATNRVYVLEIRYPDYTTARLIVLDGATNQIRSTITLHGARISGQLPSLDTAANRLYICTAPTITVIDTLRDVVLSQIDLGRGLTPHVAVPDPGIHKLYVLSGTIIATYDTQKNRLESTLDPGNNSPKSIQVNPATHELVIWYRDYTDRGMKQGVEIRKGGSAELICRVDAVDSPPEINPLANRIYLPKWPVPGPGGIRIMDGTTHKCVGALETGFLGENVANPLTGFLYIPNNGVYSDTGIVH